MEDIIVGAFIADIHFGAQDADILYKELKKNFIKPLEKMPKLDLIVLGGDTYDSKIALDSEHSKYAMRFINKDLMKVARKKNSAIRMLRGTYSHDIEQLDNFRYLEEDDEVDVKIISNTEKENFKGFNILHIPEEYVDDKDYYNKVLKCNNEYDLIFGHGMFKETAFQESKSEISMKKAPIFNSSDFVDSCYGPIMFGHIHTYTKIKKQIYYSGSFSRWVMGEELKKGFLIFIYNKKTKKYLVTRYYNMDARKFVTMDLEPYLHLPADIIIDCINQTAKDELVDKLRLKAKNVLNTDDVTTTLCLLKEYYKSNKRIVIDIKSNSILKDEAQKEIVDKYWYIFDKGQSIENKLSIYIKEDMGYSIEPEKIKSILFEEII